MGSRAKHTIALEQICALARDGLTQAMSAEAAHQAIVILTNALARIADVAKRNK